MGLPQLTNHHTTVTVFGSSRPKPATPDYETAYALGSELARAGFVVCNGAYGGTMEASARGAKAAGGSTVGVTFTAGGMALTLTGASTTSSSGEC